MAEPGSSSASLLRALPNFAEQLVEHLGLLGPVSQRPLMGGAGLYLNGNHFGMLQGQRLFFRADAATQLDYRRRGMAAYDPNPRQPFGSFFEVPEDVLDDPDELLAWARMALAATPR